MARGQTGLRGVSAVPRKLPQKLGRWFGRRPRLSGIIGGTLIVVLLAASATFVFLHLRAKDTEEARVAAMSAAEKAVPELLSYDHKTLQKEIEQKTGLLTGSFKADYAKLLRENVLPVAKKSSLVATSTVVGMGVAESDGPDRMTLLVFINQTTGPAGKDPQRVGSRVRVVMERAEDRWLIAGLKPV